VAAAAHLRRLREGLNGPLTLGELSSRLGREGAGLLVILLSAPFLQPLPTGGLAIPAGLLIAAAGLRTARGGESLRLPKLAAERRLEEPAARRLLGLAEKIVAFFERAARSRGPEFGRSPRLIGSAIVVLGLLLAAPVYIPLGAMASALPLILLGLALTEEDGLAGALGVLIGLAALAYHAAFVKLVWAATLALLRKVR
jgi:hypothetical protein